MPYKDPEGPKKYYQQNREKIIEERRQYRKDNKELISQQRKLKYEKKKQDPTYVKDRNEKERARYAKWVDSLTDEGKHKLHRRRLRDNWKKGGFKHTKEEFEIILDKFFECSHCESCGVKFDDKIKKNCDHCHLSGSFRNIICRNCNCYRAKHDYHFLKVMLELHRYFNVNFV